MKSFDEIVTENLAYLREGPDVGAPPTPPAPVAPTGGSSGVPGGDVSALPGMGAGEAQPEQDLKGGSDLDSIPSVETMLKDIQKVSPEKFREYLDAFSNNFSKLKDKEGFIKNYSEFYDGILQIQKFAPRIEQIYKEIQNHAEDLLTNKPEQPDQAKGGVGRAGPAGPAV